MNRSDIQFKKYTPTPQDQYHLGIVEIVIYEKIILRYKHVKTKDGKGDFFAAPSYTLTDGGEKRYIQSIFLDSRSDDEMLQDVMRQGMKQHFNSNSVHENQSAYTQQPTTQFYQSLSTQSSYNNQPLPF